MRRALEHGLFGFVPVIASLSFLALQLNTDSLVVDFHASYWPAATRLLQGVSPYAVTHQDILGGTAFVYPALSAIVFVPFALVNSGVAQVLYLLVCISCIPAILYALDVRDWRVYGLVMLWLPVFVGWQTGNVTLPLTFAIALIWRYRDRPIVVGLMGAVAISIKPFVWPLGLWLLATRRWRAAAWTLAFASATNGLAWWVVGFDEIRIYLHLSAAVTNALWRGGYGMMALAEHVGFGRGVGEYFLVAISVVTAASMIQLGLVQRSESGAFVLAIALMLVASPLLWSHYFALLLIPVALSRPRLSLVWGVGLLMWPMPPRQHVTGWEEALAWGLTAICVWAALPRRRRALTGQGLDQRQRPGPSERNSTLA